MVSRSACCGLNIYMYCLVVLLTGYYITVSTAYLAAGRLAPEESRHEQVTPEVILGESSGHGALAIAETPDDDVTEEGDYNVEEEDGGGSWPQHGAKKQTILTDPELETFTCFRCHGDSQTGCDILDMLNDVNFFSLKCTGKCMNISSGKLAVYDCAHDMANGGNTCIHNGDTEICFCAGNFCNGPGDVKRFLADDRPLFPPPHFGQEPGPNETATEAYSGEEDDYAGHDLASYEDQSGENNDTESSSRRTISGDPFSDTIDRDAGRRGKKTKIHGRKTAHSQGGALHLDNEGLTQQEVNVILPGKNGFLGDNETGFATTEFPVDINIPRVGKLKDSSRKSADNGATAIAILSSVTFLLCQIFHVI